MVPCRALYITRVLIVSHRMRSYAANIGLECTCRTLRAAFAPHQFKISAESSAIITNDNVGINPSQVQGDKTRSL